MTVMAIVNKQTSKVVEWYFGDQTIAYRLSQGVADEFDVISNSDDIGIKVAHVPKCGTVVEYKQKSL
jgi:hypothetical protein